MELFIVVYGSIFIFVVYKLYFDKSESKTDSNSLRLESAKAELSNLIDKIDKNKKKNIFFKKDQLDLVESVVFSVQSILNKYSIVPEAESQAKLIRELLGSFDPSNGGEPLPLDEKIIDLNIYKKVA